MKKNMVNEVAKFFYTIALPVTSASVTPAPSFSASNTKLARPFVLHVHITSYLF